MIAALRTLWDRLVRAWNRHAEQTLWKRREAKAVALLKDDWMFVKPSLDAVRAHLSHQLNKNETAESRLARIKQDGVIYHANALVFKRLLELKKFISIQPLGNSIGSAFWMTTVATNEADSGLKRLNFKVINEPIQARTVKLHNVELPVDASSNADLLEAFADTVATYLIRDVLLMTAERSTVEVKRYEKKTLESTLGSDYLTSAIMRLSNTIGERSKRGVANWIVASPSVCAVLQRSKMFEHAASLDGEIVKLRGKLHTLTVYEFSSLAEEQAIIGFKGPILVDGGAVFAPLMPLMVATPSYDPATYETIVPCMSRFGFKRLGENVAGTDDVPVVNGKDYYAILKIEVKDGRSANA